MQRLNKAKAMIGAKPKLMSLLSHRCTIPFAPLTDAVSLSPRLILRPPPLCSASSAAVIMSNRQNYAAGAAVTESGGVDKEKRALRSRVKKELNSMGHTARASQDAVIQDIILEAPWFKSCKRLCAYISCGALKEVDTFNLLKAILHDPGKKLYVPRVEDKNRNMRMFNIARIDDLIANSMNILEPAPIDADGNEREDVMLANDPVDLLLLPGLAFDKSGRRLGRGGGYYDTFLTRYQELAKERGWKQPLLVALSYSVQIMEEGVIPITPTDVPVDALVTPSGVIPISPVALDMCQ